ncbi:MAG: nuclear transport factor 2 family protein [Saprospiraceae bacterium]|nr:nuclear transport factor 2 family protein [Saprospiraceae bacterium]
MKSISFILLFAFLSNSISMNSQQSKESLHSNKDIVLKFFDGFNNPSKIQESIDLLADDYTFTNPITKVNSKADFISLAMEIGKVVSGVKIINAVENGNWVATFYEFTSDIPGVESNFASEWFRLENGVIMESHMIYDASEWRKIYAQMNQ